AAHPARRVGLTSLTARSQSLILRDCVGRSCPQTGARESLARRSTILRPCVRWNADLLGEMVHYGEGHILRCTRESPGVLEEFQQHGKPQARRASLALEQPPVLRDDRPL